MPRVVTALAALALLILLPAGSAAAKRSVPQGFYGVHYDGELAEGSKQKTEEQFAHMARSGVESTRVAFHWSAAQLSEGGPFDFSRTDAAVAAAARHGIEILPVVILAPDWARAHRRTFSPPRDPGEYAAYLRALIGRYGRTGSFWASNPDVPRRPLRTWQIWNEPHLEFQWEDPTSDDWQTGYGELLRVSYRAIKDADRRAQVVLSGLSNSSWVYLSELYAKGRIRGYYDIAGVHPYTVNARGTREIATRFRRVMAKNRDGRKRLWATEVGLPASRGREESNSTLQTTDAGMAKFLRETYSGFARTRRTRTIGVSRVYWYTWASTYCCGDIFRYTGLLGYDDFLNMYERPAYRSYVRSARRHEGCSKTTQGTCR